MAMERKWSTGQKSSNYRDVFSSAKTNRQVKRENHNQDPERFKMRRKENHGTIIFTQKIKMRKKK